MSTLLDLVEQGRLLRFDPELPPRQQEERLVYLFPRVKQKTEELLPGLESDFEHEISPEEQLYAFLADFCAGETLEFDRQFHVLHHHERGVWEMKTRDLRLFGWFYRQDCFVWTNLDLKRRLLAVRGLVSGYRDEAVRDRDALPLVGSKYVEGDRPNDVVSNFRFPPTPGGSSVR